MSKAKRARRQRKDAAPKAVFSFRKHLLPPLIGLFVMVLVFILLNSQLLLAQVHYRLQKPVTAITTILPPPYNRAPDPSAGDQIIIPAIDSTAPIIFEPSTDEKAVEKALLTGVDHYGGTANPGQTGNSVIFGHSSGQLWSSGKYKYIFTLLNKLKPGDQIIIDYQGKRYIYKVTSSDIILPTNLSVLNQNVHKPTLTLITCSPVGTNRNRLVVHADQISPVPPKTSQPAVTNIVRSEKQLPGNGSTSLWKTLTGWL
jgi:sortase A